MNDKLTRIIIVLILIFSISIQAEDKNKVELKEARPFGIVMDKNIRSTGIFRRPYPLRFSQKTLLNPHELIQVVYVYRGGRKIIAISLTLNNVPKGKLVYERFKRELTVKYGKPIEQIKREDTSSDKYSALIWKLKGYKDVQEIVLKPDKNFRRCTIKYYSKGYCDLREQNKRKKEEHARKLIQSSKNAL